MAANFLLEADNLPIAILFSAEARVDDPGKRMFVRLLVDGAPNYFVGRRLQRSSAFSHKSFSACPIALDLLPLEIDP